MGFVCSPWPEQALRANIHAQISLALNRIYTEWYLSKGYNFDITGSPGYDQIYTHGRTIFQSVKTIAEEIFDTYVRKTGTVNPYFTEYCDGKTVTCKGMSQWGTVTKANQGQSALQILKSYYGSDIEILTSSNIQSIPRSYPGSPLRVGSSGTNVAILQRQLNRIARDYPFFGTVEVDGYFGAATEEVVKKFQKQFGLAQDGVVGKSTWYKISYIYVSVKDLAELTSEGETALGGLDGGSWEGTTLRRGSTGSAVERVQFWLDALSLYDASLDVTVDGRFGAGTEQAVRNYQRLKGLTADGIVGRATWEALYADYASAQGDADGRPATQYPGSPLRQGDRGSNVKLVQFYLRMAATLYTALDAPAVDGIFGSGTRAAVVQFQNYFGLSADGVVGRNTWDKLTEVYLGVTNALLSPSLRPGQFPGTLRRGSTGTAVRELQYY
ncbi:MAG: peptidoglycan-binding protein, partial [Oscillospiraceae bacterium]|nr:peptidoglycan-binding protein [Oscillospiraceae bacterium]